MASCGKEYCPDTRCGIKHPFNGGKRTHCEAVKACMARVCAPLSSLGEKGFLLYDSCLGSCQTATGQFQSSNDYLCANFNPQDLIYYYGVNPCGGEVTEVWQTQTDQTQKEAYGGSKTNTMYLLAAVAVLGLAIWLIFKK